jgi:hypothetical protein
MNSFSRKAFVSALITAAVFTALTMSCETGTSSNQQEEEEYSTATAKVDYNGAKKAVFIDFSSETAVRELPLDFFDFAVFVTPERTVSVIANSGSYGSGVTVYKTTSGNITEDCTSLQNNVTEYTFKAGTNLYNSGQTAANPFEGGLRAAPMGSNPAWDKVFLIKTGAGNYYKVLFEVFGMLSINPPTPGYTIHVVPGLGAGDTGKVTITDSITSANDYGYIWFKLDGGPRALNSLTALKSDAPDIPKAADWDLLCIRTNELQSKDGTTLATEMPMASRSSILLNTYKDVKAYTAAGKTIAEVLNISGLTESGEVDAIGYGWYSTTDDMPPTFTLKTNTYVVKTVEGNYAKFQPGSFYGPNRESFYMNFRYLYGDSSGTFER